MLNEFKTAVENRFPELGEKGFLLACSGGLDSTVLVDLCAKLKLDFALAHCNFRLRGADSDGDEDFVRNLAQDLNKTLYVTHFDTIGYVNKYKVSVQMAARKLRYAWFAEIMARNGIKTLVTAHHADDNLETFLINLSRGTGIDGLKGIPEKTKTIARPLLQFTRKQIVEYAKAEKLQWREDSSNADVKYLRNNIRHGILPLLKESNPNFMDNFRATQTYLGQTAAIAENHIVQAKEAIFVKDGEIVRIPIKEITYLNPLKGYLYGLFKDYGFTEWNDVENLLSAMSGKEIRSKTHRLLKDRDCLLLSEIKADNDLTYRIGETLVQIDTPLKIKIERVKVINEIGDHILYVDKKALKYPLTLRKWEKGDYFYPLGMGGQKKLSKFFKDEKVDVISKENQWLLCSDKAIVWVVGKRADERFKVSKSTEQIVKFELNR